LNPAGLKVEENEDGCDNVSKETPKQAAGNYREQERKTLY